MKVSIITPTYHRFQMLPRCCDAVRRQTLVNWEHIICSDGGFEQQALEQVNKMDDPRFIYRFVTEPHKDAGWSVRRHVLDNYATGDVVIFLDDDNYIAPTYLEKMVKALDKGWGDAGLHGRINSTDPIDQPMFAICQILHYGPLPAFWGDPPRVLTGVPPKLFFIDTLQILVYTDILKKIDWGELDYYSDGRIYERLGKDFKWVEVPEILCVHH